MAQIVDFARKKKAVNEANRWKALAKGNIRHFTCDLCGSDIEVVNNVFPHNCPGCGLEITQWNNAEENR